jgi:DNA polymerase I
VKSWGFKEIFLVDFEFKAPDGERPVVHCLVVEEMFSGRTQRYWIDELEPMKTAPFDVSDNTLFVAFYASAELSCFKALNWPFPKNILDLFIEFKNKLNGLRPPSGFGLLGALIYYGIDRIENAEKKAMRDLAMRGGPYTSEEQSALIDYCESDVLALSRLLPAMSDRIDLPRALLRGRYVKAAAEIEWNGTPIDAQTLKKFRQNWDTIQQQLINEINAGFNVYDGRVFKIALFEKWLIQNNISWPQLKTGRLDLSDNTFKEMARSHPKVSQLRELRQTLSSMRLLKLAVGSDARNRCLLSMFASKTGRNQPSNTKFIFGPSAWLRGLIKPTVGNGIAYVDWSQQEFAIAAVLSGDEQMMEAYKSGDPYLAFAKQAGAVPTCGTKQTHPEERKLYKACALAVQYGMGKESLAIRIGKAPIDAAELLRKHKETYRVFWEWSDAVVDVALTRGHIDTVFGWRLHIDQTPNDRSIRNFPVQGNGAEILRLACCLVTEAGINVCCPVHDALLIEAPLDELDNTIIKTQELMSEAGRIVLNGFELRTDVDVVKYPDRYMDERGEKMWAIISKLAGCWGCIKTTTGGV